MKWCFDKVLEWVIKIGDEWNQGIIAKEYQKMSKNSVSAYVVAILAVVTLIKDCYKI